MKLKKINNITLLEAKEDIAKFVDKYGQETYDLFQKSRDRLKNHGYSTDILYWWKNDDKKELPKILDNLLYARARGNKTAKVSTDEWKPRGDYKYLGQYKGYDVYRVNDYIASMDLGINTGWCTTGRYKHYGDPQFVPNDEAAEEHFNSYKHNGVTFYYLLDPKTHYGKYAFAVYDRVFKVERRINNYYINKTNFELFNAKDVLYYEKLDSFPIDIIQEDYGSELILDVVDTKESDSIIIDGKLVKYIGNEQSYKVPDDVTVIGDHAFLNNEKLKDVTISDSVKTIGQFAFARCNKLEKITIPNSVTLIDNRAFYGCINLQKVVISGNVEIIGENAFASCTKLNTVVLENGIKNIGDSVFYNCQELITVVIPDSVEVLGQWLFADCVKLTDVTIGRNVREIGFAAFIACKNIKKIVYRGSKDQLHKITKKDDSFFKIQGNPVIECQDGQLRLDEGLKMKIGKRLDKEIKEHVAVDRYDQLTKENVKPVIILKSNAKGNILQDKDLNESDTSDKLDESLKEDYKDFAFIVKCNDGPKELVRVVAEDKSKAEKYAKKMYAQNHTTYADDRYNVWSIEDKNESITEDKEDSLQPHTDGLKSSVAQMEKKIKIAKEQAEKHPENRAFFNNMISDLQSHIDYNKKQIDKFENAEKVDLADVFNAKMMDRALTDRDEKNQETKSDRIKPDVLKKDTEAFEKLEKAAELLAKKSPNKYKYSVGDTYLDFGSDYQWTTIITYKQDGSSYQALNPAQWEEIVNSKSDNELEKAVIDVLKDRFNPDRKRGIETAEDAMKALNELD